MTTDSNSDIDYISNVVKQKAREKRNKLIKDRYDDGNPQTDLDGLCYVVSEALYHLTGSKSTWTPKQIKHEGVSHWFLVHKDTGEIYDLTRDQFSSCVPYSEARGRGFCTGKPSKRAKKLIKSVNKEIK